MYNLRRQSLRTFSPLANEQEVELTHSVNHHQIAMLITATVTIANGTTDGAVATDGVADIVEYVRINSDGLDVVQQIPGIDLLRLERFSNERAPLYEGLADAGVQADTVVRAIVPINFTLPHLTANPFDLFLPAMPVQQQLRAYVKIREAADCATALVTGGDRDVTVSAITVEFVEVYSVADVQPWYLPVITVGFTEEFSAASTEHLYRFRTSNRILSQLFEYREATGALADKINSVTLRSGLQTWDRQLPFHFLQGDLVTLYDADAIADGRLFFSYADNGKLTTVLNPRNMGTDPRYEFNVDAPATTARLRVINRELVVKPPFTQVGA